MGLKQKPKRGDLIEIFRSVYEHWAVYVGDGFVVHLVQHGGGLSSSSNSGISPQTIKVQVKMEKLCDVVGKHKWKVNNKLDKKYKPRPVCDIVNDAYAMVGETLPYCLVSANCEHFATELRYGKAESRQVRRSGKAIVASGLAAGIAAGAVAGLAAPVAGAVLVGTVAGFFTSAVTSLVSRRRNRKSTRK